MPPHTCRDRSVTVDGAHIAYRECGDRSAPAVVLVHGLLSDSETFAADLEPLAERGIRAIAVDLLGHGASDKPSGLYLLDDFALFLDGFLAALGLESATICGHSLGGAIAVHFGYHYPHRVQRLVLVSAGGLGKEVNIALRLLSVPGVERVTGLVMGRRLVQRVLRSPWVHRRFHVTEARMPNLRRVGRTLFRADARAAFFRSLRGVIGPRGQLGSFIEMDYLAAHLPTLLVWSDRDPVIPLAHGRRTHEHLPASELLVLPGGGHEPHRRSPTEFADAVSRFILT